MFLTTREENSNSQVISLRKPELTHKKSPAAVICSAAHITEEPPSRLVESGDFLSFSRKNLVI
jgi:hypothetical protein